MTPMRKVIVLSAVLAVIIGVPLSFAEVSSSSNSEGSIFDDQITTPSGNLTGGPTSPSLVGDYARPVLVPNSDISDYTTPTQGFGSSTILNPTTTVIGTSNATTSISDGHGRGWEIEPTSEFINRSIIQISAQLLNGNSPKTGTLIFGVWDSSSVLKRQVGTLNASTIISGYNDYTVLDTQLTKLEAGDFIGVIGDDDLSGRIHIYLTSPSSGADYRDDVWDSTGRYGLHMPDNLITNFDNLFDDNTGTIVKTDIDVNPFLMVGESDTVTMSALSVYFPSSGSDITEFTVDTSLDKSTWTKQRTILYSKITEDDYNFISFPVTDANWIRISGTDVSGKTLAISEMKIEEPTDNEVLKLHRHFSISTTDTRLELDGTR